MQLSKKTSQLTIETKPIPILYPHEHKIEDSVFNSDHHIRALSETVIIQEDLWITRFEAVLKNAPMAVLHHAGVILPDEKKRTCPNSIRGREIFAVTPDMAASPVEFEEPYGVFLPKGTSILLGVLFHNPLSPFGPGEAYKDVSVSIIMDIQKDSPAIQKKPLEYYRMHIDDISCPGVVEEEVFVVPPGAKNFVKKGEERNGLNPSRYTFSRSGEVVYMISHLHPWEGGEKLDVYLNGKQIISFIPVHTSSELWSWIIPHISSVSIRVNPGDVLSITATYSNPNPVPIVGAMGMMIFYFAPDDSGAASQNNNDFVLPDGKKFRILSLAQKYGLIKEMTQVRGFEEARDFLRRTYPDEPTDDHELIHVIGEAAFLELGYEAFDICDSFFHFGCYHGVALEAVRQNGYNEKVLKDLVGVCLDPSNNRTIALSCIHGIGHGLMVVGGYDLISSYQDCDSILEDEVNRFFCYNGASMESVLRMYESNNALNSLYSEDPYYPCDSIPQKYRPACVREYVYYVRKVFYEYDTDKTIAYCLYFASQQTRQECFIGMGSAMTQDFFEQPERIIKECNKLAQYGTRYNLFCLQKAATNYAYASQFESADMLCVALSKKGEQEDCLGAVEYAESAL